jgi:hypothetical protein
MESNIFWNICELNRWKEIVIDQYKTLLNSKILDKVKNVNVTFLGEKKENLNFLLELNEKIKIKQYSNNIFLFESLILNNLLDWSKTNKSNVLYIHTKGCSHSGRVFDNVWQWRKLMEHFLIHEHDNCVKLLEENDAIGCLPVDAGKPIRILEEKHNMHFSGNFWWSKTDYISTLPRLPDVDMRKNKNYWICERWILYHHPRMKIHIAYDSNTKHYYKCSPEIQL